MEATKTKTHGETLVSQKRWTRNPETPRQRVQRRWGRSSRQKLKLVRAHRHATLFLFPLVYTPSRKLSFEKTPLDKRETVILYSCGEDCSRHEFTSTLNSTDNTLRASVFHLISKPLSFGAFLSLLPTGVPNKNLKPCSTQPLPPTINRPPVYLPHCSSIHSLLNGFPKRFN